MTLKRKPERSEWVENTIQKKKKHQKCKRKQKTVHVKIRKNCCDENKGKFWKKTRTVDNNLGLDSHTSLLWIVWHKEMEISYGLPHLAFTFISLHLLFWHMHHSNDMKT